MEAYGNYLGVLKWSLAQGDGKEVDPSTVKPMSKEDRDFLDNVMKHIVVNEAEVLRNKLKILQLEKEGDAVRYDEEGMGEEDDKKKRTGGAVTTYKDDVEREELTGRELDSDASSLPLLTRKLNALARMKDICENLDQAVNLLVIGGFPIIIGIMSEYREGL